MGPSVLPALPPGPPPQPAQASKPATRSSTAGDAPAAGVRRLAVGIELYNHSIINFLVRVTARKASCQLPIASALPLLRLIYLQRSDPECFSIGSDSHTVPAIWSTLLPVRTRNLRRHDC